MPEDRSPTFGPDRRPADNGYRKGQDTQKGEPLRGRSLESIAALGDLTPDYDQDRTLRVQPVMPGSAKWPHRRKRFVSEKQVEAAERKRQLIELRIQGLSCAEIGQQVGASASTVGRIVSRVLKETTAEAADELRTLLVARCESLISRLWLLAIGGEFEVTRRKKDGTTETVKELRPPDLGCVREIRSLVHEIAQIHGVISSNPAANQKDQSLRKSPLDPRVAEAMTAAAMRSMRDLGQLPGPEDDDPGPDDDEPGPGVSPSPGAEDPA